MNRLIIICGISFAGKTTLGKTIAQRFGYAEVDVDDVKFHLFGHDIKDEDLSQEDWVRLYAETDKLIDRYLQAGKTVIVASRNFKKSERELAKVTFAFSDDALAKVVKTGAYKEVKCDD